MIQTTIEAIEALPLFAAARRTDPATSKAAAARAPAFTGDHARRILAALEAGPAGKTEIGRRCGLTEQQVARRMHELRRAGLVERTGREVRSESGCGEDEYRRAGDSSTSVKRCEQAAEAIGGRDNLGGQSNGR